MALLPIYLRLVLGAEAAAYVQSGPFIQAFIWLIAIAFVMAALVDRVSSGLGLAPVPATALAPFVVVTAVVPQLGQTLDRTLSVVPVYVAFAVLAPLVGWSVSRLGYRRRGGRGAPQRRRRPRRRRIWPQRRPGYDGENGQLRRERDILKKAALIFGAASR
jgi:hypothetical protein